MKIRKATHKDLKRIESIILSKKDLLKDYKLIAFFGSCLDSNNFFDIDLVSIGKNKTHKLIKRDIRRELLKDKLNVIFFETVKKQPITKKNNEVLIHDLHYSSLEEFYKKEWKDIINEIKKSAKTIYGSKDIIKKVEVSDKEFLSILSKWASNIKTNKDYLDFKNYFLKTNSKILKIHPNLNSIIKDILFSLSKDNWKKSKEDIKILLNKELK